MFYFNRCFRHRNRLNRGYQRHLMRLNTVKSALNPIDSRVKLGHKVKIAWHWTSTFRVKQAISFHSFKFLCVLKFKSFIIPFLKFSKFEAKRKIARIILDPRRYVFFGSISLYYRCNDYRKFQARFSVALAILGCMDPIFLLTNALFWLHPITDWVCWDFYHSICLNIRAIWDRKMCSWL